MEAHEIDHFFTSLETISVGAKTVSKQLAYEIGSNFSFFDYMRLDELGLSRIIANLLSPEGTHGQGAIFLELFMKACGFKISDAHDPKKAAVFVELPFENGRMDIVVKFSAGILMVIENKPWAAEQPDQLERYATYLSIHEGNKGRLVFLPGYMEDSATIKPETIRQWNSKEPRYAVLPYNAANSKSSLSDWLRECSKHAKALKVRIFLEEFADWNEAHFPKLSITDNGGIL